MNLKWNLRELYKNNEEFYNEINYVKKLLYEVMNSNVDINDANDLLFLLNSEWHIKELANNILVYGSLMYYKNIKSEECIKLKDDAEKFSNEVNSKLKFIENKILTCGKNKIFRLLEENTDLQIYKQHINNLFRLQEHIQKEEINNVIRDNNNKISEYINKYNKLLRDIDYGQIEVNDETIEINSSNFAKYISSRDRETRKKTYLSVDNCFNVKNDEFADLLNNIYGYRIENYFTSVFKQTMYTEYENELYSFRKENDLTKKILSEKYFKLIKKYYGENITYDEEASYEWSRLGHLYRWSYYPYKYATGLIMASVVVNSLIDEKTLSKEQYMEFLASGSCMYSLDLLKMLNIDLTNSDIINEGFNILKKDVEELEKNLILKK